MREIPFSILKEDYEASGKEYNDIHNCPFNKAVIRQLPELGRVLVSTDYIYSKSPFFAEYSIARIKQEFTYEDFDRLSRGIEFHTTLILK